MSRINNIPSPSYSSGYNLYYEVIQRYCLNVDISSVVQAIIKLVSKQEDKTAVLNYLNNHEAVPRDKPILSKVIEALKKMETDLCSESYSFLMRYFEGNSDQLPDTIKNTECGGFIMNPQHYSVTSDRSFSQNSNVSPYYGVKLDRETFNKLISNGVKNFQGVDLSGVDLRGLDLSGLTYNGFDLKDANLCGAKLDRVVLQEIIRLGVKNLQGVDLSDVDLNGID